MNRMTPEKEALGINADQTNPGDPADAEKFSEILYRKGGVHRGPKGTKYSYIGANSEAEVKRLKKQGWCLSFEEAVFGKLEEDPDDGEELM